MEINFKEYLINTLQDRRTELSNCKKIAISRADITTEMNETLFYKETILNAYELILKEL